MFSPWYRWAGRRRPHDHCCINVALYGPGGRWTMTERGETAVRQSPRCFQVGPSRMRWDGGALAIDIDEIATPRLSRIRGSIRLIPSAVTGESFALDATGAHRWQPIAPTARIEVDIDRPGWRWAGSGYFDANAGTRALEADFRYWTWARMPLRDGTAVFYDAERRDGSTLGLSLRFAPDGRVEPFDAPPMTRMARSRWLVRRQMRADPGHGPRQVRPMLDAPFYTRSVVRSRIAGEESEGVHEALDLDRFATRLIKPMLALRVPRRARF